MALSYDNVQINWCFLLSSLYEITHKASKGVDIAYQLLIKQKLDDKR